MKLPFLKQNFNLTIDTTKFDSFLLSLKEVSDRWVATMLVLIRTIGSLFGLLILIATIVVTTSWFIDAYGPLTFVLSILLTSFVVAVLGNVSIVKSK